MRKNNKMFHQHYTMKFIKIRMETKRQLRLEGYQSTLEILRLLMISVLIYMNKIYSVFWVIMVIITN